MSASVREEAPGDHAAIRDITTRAFGGQAEADLVDALRSAARPFISLVAVERGAVVGHICFSPVTIDDAVSSDAMGLAPMAVAPELQRRGIGSQLIRSGLDECRRRGVVVVVVLGHPGYYPRFGFVPARQMGLTCEYPVPDEVFMAMELAPGALRGPSGLVRYHAAFGRF
jgi:putative acetyltransferase